MRIDVEFVNPRTGYQKKVKVGWSWVLLFLSGVLGIPLYMRRLYAWGVVFSIIWVLGIVLTSLSNAAGIGAVFIFVTILQAALQIYLAAKGNEITGKNLLNTGWEFKYPDSDGARFARLKWGLVDHTQRIAPVFK